MKRIILILMILVLSISLYGCGQQTEQEIVIPVIFYYHNNLDSKDNFEDVFVLEVREGSHFQNDTLALLNNYFAGPVSEGCVNPFPTGLQAISFEQNENTARIILSDQIAKLSAIDLTMAASCLSLTVFELTPCNTITISAENSLIANQTALVITKDSLLFTDNAHFSIED